MTKLGPHLQYSSDISRRWATVAPIVKQLDNKNALEIAPKGAITIYRKWYSTEVQNRRLRDPIQGWYVANEIHESLDGFIPTYVELFNETFQTLGDGLEDHVEFTRYAVWRLHELGHKVAAFSFSTGNPRDVDYHYLAGTQWAGADALTLRQYWGSQGYTYYHALRHRFLHDLTDGNHPPIIIGECGRDRVEGGQGGWIKDGISPEQYVNELLGFDYLIQQDEYVLGATPFTSAPNEDWQSFDMDQITEMLLSRISSKNNPLILLEEEENGS